MKKLLMVIASMFLLGGCATVASSLVSVPDEELAREHLTEQGYVDIIIEGWGGAGCPGGGSTISRKNHSSTAFKASTPKGRQVKGKVCCARDKTCKVYEE